MTALTVGQQRGIEINVLHNLATQFAAYPILTQAEEQQLTHQVAENNDRAAAEKLILAHMRYVISVAKGYLNYGLPAQDLVQEGTIGLMKAVKNFSPDKNVRLVSYACHWIKAAMHEYILKNWRLVKIATTKAQRKLFFNLRKLQEKIGTGVSAEKEIAEHLNVSEQDVQEMAGRFHRGEESLSLTYDDEEQTPKHAISYANDNPADLIDQATWQQQAITSLHEALPQLDKRLQMIIKHRWLCDSEQKMSLKLLAEQLNVSIERIRQLEKQALVKLHALMA